MNEKIEKQIKIENEINKINKLFSELNNFDGLDEFRQFIMGISFYKTSQEILKWTSEVLSENEVQIIKNKFLFPKKSTKREILWDNLFLYCYNLVECLKEKDL